MKMQRCLDASLRETFGKWFFLLVLASLTIVLLYLVFGLNGDGGDLPPITNR
jgi:hypothetical protein